MPKDSASDLGRHALASFILVAGLLVGWLAYAPGLGGSLQFDDYHNLGGLAAVHDPKSAFRFVATGMSGPLGRPVALATFVPQAYAWPMATDVFLYTNILIHLLNGVLVVWFLYLLGCARRQPPSQAAMIAAGAGVLWMLLPLLASSSLFIVQRMATLSATFVLLGGIGYFYCRRGLKHRPLLALCGMTVALGAGAALGALTKENGILLFLFILAAETSLLERPSNVRPVLWKSWTRVVLILPLLLLVYYLVSILPYPESIVLRRNFGGFERLLTQAEILWRYLYLAFLPNVQSLGPFHDDYGIQRSLFNPRTLLAVGAWFGVIAGAILLRRRAPLFTFAVAWYLFGHLLESTTVSLELYFEHRNYLPLVGPVYAIVAATAHVQKPWQRLAVFGLMAYAGLLGVVLYSTTSLWGSPALAAEMWQIYKPASQRAVQHLARSLEQQGDPYTTRRVLNHFLAANPDSPGIRLQVLAISCQLEPDTDFGDTVRSLEARLPDAPYDQSAGEAYLHLYGLVHDGRCPGLDEAAMYGIGEALLANPRYNLPIVRHNIHVALARVGIERKDFGLTMAHMEEALREYHNSETLLLAMGILNSGGRFDLSRALYEEAKARQPPRNPLQALHWKSELDRMQHALIAMDRSRSHN